MITEELVRNLSETLRIDKERIAREYYEMLILDEISKKEWSQYLIFKGGTALRLAFGSPRFSDGLDFSILSTINPGDVFNFAKYISRNYGVEITDSHKKRATILVEFRISEQFLTQAFRLKIEISMRIESKLPYNLEILSSSVYPLKVLFQVMDTGYMFHEKIRTFKERKEPRDLFDIWFLSEKLKMEIPVDEIPEIEARKLKQVLRKYLPTNWYRAIDEIQRLLEK
jgi:predicted nucleotidyltransferase component of viral defense system